MNLFPSVCKQDTDNYERPDMLVYSRGKQPLSTWIILNPAALAEVEVKTIEAKSNLATKAVKPGWKHTGCLRPALLAVFNIKSDFILQP